ncbi:hypothetical protein D3C87_1915300 [compost metagenome]
MLPHVGANPPRHLLAALGIDLLGQSCAQAAICAIGVAELHPAEVVLGAVDSHMLVNQLRLRFERPVVSKGKGISGFDGCQRAPTVGIRSLPTR